MIDLTLQTIFMRALVVLIVSAVQGGAVAAAAVALGDAGPRHDGRLTASPFPHVDLLGAAGLVLFGLGWAKPVAVDPAELRGGRAALVAVTLAGAVALVLAAVGLRMLVGPALTSLPVSGGLVAAAFLRTAAALCLASAVFGLLPLPPLPGGHLLAAAGLRVPERWVWVGAVVLLALAASGVARMIVRPVVAVLGAG